MERLDLEAGEQSQWELVQLNKPDDVLLRSFKICGLTNHSMLILSTANAS